jgi:hypothetical protein
VVPGGDDGPVLVLDRRTGVVLAEFGPGGHVTVMAVVHASDVIAISLNEVRSHRFDRTA